MLRGVQILVLLNRILWLGGVPSIRCRIKRIDLVGTDRTIDGLRGLRWWRSRWARRGGVGETRWHSIGLDHARGAAVWQMGTLRLKGIEAFVFMCTLVATIHLPTSAWR